MAVQGSGCRTYAEAAMRRVVSLLKSRAREALDMLEGAMPSGAQQVEEDRCAIFSKPGSRGEPRLRHDTMCIRAREVSEVSFL